VHEELVSREFLQRLIEEEAEELRSQEREMANAVPEMDVEEWNREYDLIYAELNDYLALEMLEADEAYHYEKYEQMKN
jgi:hypothetical protein